MTKLRSLKALAIIFFVSGLYDAFGGFYFAFSVGTGRSVDNPPTHVFYAIFIASFLFSFAFPKLFAEDDAMKSIRGGAVISGF